MAKINKDTIPTIDELRMHLEYCGGKLTPQDFRLLTNFLEKNSDDIKVLIENLTGIRIVHFYESIQEMETDPNPINIYTGKPIQPGEIVMIRNTEDSEDPDNGNLYVYTEDSWEYLTKFGDIEPEQEEFNDDYFN